MSEKHRDIPTADDADVVVVDADDYNRQQRFQEIHKARQRVTEYLAGLDEVFEDMRDRSPGAHPLYVGETLAFRVSLYVMELLPLLRQRGGDDPFFEEQFPEETAVDDLEEYARRSGIVASNAQKARYGSLTFQMEVFQVANRAYAELGMEPDLNEQESTAAFDYSDLLEDDSGGDRPEMLADGGED